MSKKLRAIPFNQSAVRLISVAASIVLLLFLVFVIIARSVSASYERREREQRTDTVTSIANSFDKMIDNASELVLMFYAKAVSYTHLLPHWTEQTQRCFFTAAREICSRFSAVMAALRAVLQILLR